MPTDELIDSNDVQTTASFTMTVAQLLWIKSERQRRGLRSNSEVVRELIAEAMGNPAQQPAEASVAA